MTPIDLLLIGVIVLVLLLVYYFMGKKRKPIEIPQKIAVAVSKPPKRPLEIFIDPDVGSRVNIVSLSTVDELEKVIDEIVEVNMADRKAINEEATRLEQRIIADQEIKLQDLKTASETVIVEKKEELSASQKLLAEMLKKKQKKMEERKLLLQKQREAAYALEREKNRIENEKKLAEIKLKRQQAIEAKERVTSENEAERTKLQVENKRLLAGARDKAAQDLIRTEEEAVEAERVMREKTIQLAMEEAIAQEDLKIEREKYVELEIQYKHIQQVEQAKIDTVMEELDIMLEEETARKVKMEEEDKRIRAEQKQKLLDANAAAVAELEEAEAEQARLDAEAKLLRDKLDAEMLVQEGEQRRTAEFEKSEYDKKTAADQAALDAAQSESSRTGDSMQQSERDAARALEARSEKDWATTTARERQRETDQLAEWAKAGTVVPGGSGGGNSRAVAAAIRLAAMSEIPKSMSAAEHKKCMDAASTMNSSMINWQANLDNAYASVYWYSISGADKRRMYSDGVDDRANKNKYKDHYHRMKAHLSVAYRQFAEMPDICALPAHSELKDNNNWNYLQQAIDMEKKVKDDIRAYNARIEREAAAQRTAAANRRSTTRRSPPPKAKTS
jgi:hypothetical protein